MAQIYFNNTKSMSREENSFRKTNTSTEKKIVRKDSHQTNTFRLDISFGALPMKCKMGFYVKYERRPNGSMCCYSQHCFQFQFSSVYNKLVT